MFWLLLASFLYALLHLTEEMGSTKSFFLHDGTCYSQFLWISCQIFFVAVMAVSFITVPFDYLRRFASKKLDVFSAWTVPRFAVFNNHGWKYVK